VGILNHQDSSSPTPLFGHCAPVNYSLWWEAKQNELICNSLNNLEGRMIQVDSVKIIVEDILPQTKNVNTIWGLHF
jgi:hypothetical protein